MMPKILVVEDEDSLRITLAANLELEDFEVIEAEHAEAAVEILDREHIDLVLSDIRMPGMSGVDLFFHIKQKHPKVPVVLMTAFTAEDQIDQALDAGVYTVLSKPFTVEDTIATLSRAMGSPIVLVVDDDEQDARDTASALRDRGLTTIVVGDGESALLALQQANVDVCVTELELPDEDEGKFVERLRSTHPSVTVIALSSCTMPDLLRQVADVGAYTFIRKPVDATDLVRAIARARGADHAVR